jgi:hypothetical protein
MGLFDHPLTWNHNPFMDWMSPDSTFTEMGIKGVQYGVIVPPSSLTNVTSNVG